MKNEIMIQVTCYNTNCKKTFPVTKNMNDTHQEKPITSFQTACPICGTEQTIELPDGFSLKPDYNTYKNLLME